MELLPWPWPRLPRSERSSGARKRRGFGISLGFAQAPESSDHGISPGLPDTARLCFYAFQIIYPPAVALLPPPGRVTMIAPNTHEERVLLQWLEAEDPAIASTTHPLNPKVARHSHDPARPFLPDAATSAKGSAAGSPQAWYSERATPSPR